MQDHRCTAETSTETGPLPLEVPRFQIVHLMLWTLGSATNQAITQGIRSLVHQGDRLAVIQDLSGVLRGIIFGAVITGAIVLVQTSQKGGFPFCRLPGHWLVVVMTLTAVAHLVG